LHYARYEKTAAGIPACNVYNYDETNLQDNPGASKAIYPRGARHAEQVQDSTKSCISVMICASATGVLLPPFVVYKAGVYILTKTIPPSHGLGRYGR